MNTFAIVLAVIDIIVCIALVLLVVFQEGNSRGLGAISGGADTFFGRGKGRSIDHLLKQLTSILAVVFALLSVVLYLITGRVGA